MCLGYRTADRPLLRSTLCSILCALVLLLTARAHVHLFDFENDARASLAKKRRKKLAKNKGQTNKIERIVISHKFSITYAVDFFPFVTPKCAHSNRKES